MVQRITKGESLKAYTEFSVFHLPTRIGDFKCRCRTRREQLFSDWDPVCMIKSLPLAHFVSRSF